MHLWCELMSIGFYPVIKIYQIAVTLPWIVTKVKFFEFSQRVKNIPRKCPKVIVGKLDCGHKLKIFK